MKQNYLFGRTTEEIAAKISENELGDPDAYKSMTEAEQYALAGRYNIIGGRNGIGAFRLED